MEQRRHDRVEGDGLFVCDVLGDRPEDGETREQAAKPIRTNASRARGTVVGVAVSVLRAGSGGIAGLASADRLRGAYAVVPLPARFRPGVRETSHGASGIVIAFGRLAQLVRALA